MSSAVIMLTNLYESLLPLPSDATAHSSAEYLLKWMTVEQISQTLKTNINGHSFCYVLTDNLHTHIVTMVVCLTKIRLALYYVFNNTDI